MSTAFLANEQRILSAFRARGETALGRTREGDDIEATGLRSSTPTQGYETGLIVALTYELVVAHDLARIAQRIGNTIAEPKIVYTPDTLHTTIGTTAVTHGNAYDDWRQLRESGHELLATVMPALKAFRGNATIAYDAPTLDEKTLIMPPLPTPSDTFARLVDTVQESGAKRNISIKPAWGRHCTLARFGAEQRTGLSDVADAVARETLFGKTLYGHPLPGHVQPQSILIGAYRWGASDNVPHFDIAAYGRYYLR